MRLLPLIILRVALLFAAHARARCARYLTYARRIDQGDINDAMQRMARALTAR